MGFEKHLKTHGISTSCGRNSAVSRALCYARRNPVALATLFTAECTACPAAPACIKHGYGRRTPRGKPSTTDKFETAFAKEPRPGMFLIQKCISDGATLMLATRKWKQMSGRNSAVSRALCYARQNPVTLATLFTSECTACPIAQACLKHGYGRRTPRGKPSTTVC